MTLNASITLIIILLLLLLLLPSPTYSTSSSSSTTTTTITTNNTINSSQIPIIIITTLHTKDFQPNEERGEITHIQGKGFVFTFEGQCGLLDSPLCHEKMIEFKSVVKEWKETYPDLTLSFYFVNQTEDPTIWSSLLDPPPPFYRYIEHGVPVDVSFRAESRSVKTIVKALRRAYAPTVIPLETVDEVKKFIGRENILRNDYELITFVLVIPESGSVMSIEALKENVAPLKGSWLPGSILAPYRGKILFGYVKYSSDLLPVLCPTSTDKNTVEKCHHQLAHENPCLMRFELGYNNNDDEDVEPPMILICGYDTIIQEYAIRRAVERTRFPLAQRLSTPNYMDVVHNLLSRRVLIA
jgi:hypothetical protein